MQRRQFLSSGLGAGLACAGLPPAAAASGAAGEWPVRPVKLIVPFPPGGPTDIIGRTAARVMGERLGQQIVVENKAGAGGNIGTDAVAKAMPDGYTIGLSAISSLAIAPSLYARLPYSVERDLAPISLAGYTPCAIVAHPGAPFDDLAGLIAYAKAHPGKLSYGTSGLGTSTHLAAEYFQSIAGVSMLHVPYKGTSQIAQDLLAGTIPLSFESSLTTTLPNVREGRVKVIAVTSARRSRALPQVATVAEQGFAGFDVVTWFGLIGPARLPRELAHRISGAWQTGSATPLARQAFENIGADPQAGSPQQFGDFMRSETQRWGALIRKLGIQLD
ncbi:MULTISPECIES: tripartite tricarboxylate transporter substrate binding protein [Delftia]|uniref:Tripartite tricarboxylate transporter substrate binding protein n=1 Tax=Delftia acidovorans TaxID=80866 RepID=A0A7T2VXA1_DELAC|nr:MULTISPECIES: tripartite tricarboxylate transporter substrate binding protein [Delftia]MBB1648170.1 twin-arginine translocation pathway signal [Delftia sp. UME58]QPS06746.1 tripartite tricarboxylate transporter substrate binding protein [Delftia acidovorans]